MAFTYEGETNTGTTGAQSTSYYDRYLQEQERILEAQRKAAEAQRQAAYQQAYNTNPAVQQSMDNSAFRRNNPIQGSLGMNQPQLTWWQKFINSISTPGQQSMYNAWQSPGRSPWAALDPRSPNPTDPMHSYQNTMYGNRVQGFLNNNQPKRLGLSDYDLELLREQRRGYQVGMPGVDYYQPPAVLTDTPPAPTYEPFVMPEFPTYSYGGGGGRRSSGYTPAANVGRWFNAMANWNINQAQPG